MSVSSRLDFVFIYSISLFQHFVLNILILFNFLMTFATTIFRYLFLIIFFLQKVFHFELSFVPLTHGNEEYRDYCIYGIKVHKVENSRNKNSKPFIFFSSSSPSSFIVYTSRSNSEFVVFFVPLPQFN